MKKQIRPINPRQLKDLIVTEMATNGPNCDLNHIDVSKVKSMGYLFINSKFNGDISKWDVSNVKDMGSLFKNSQFNGDISNWDVSRVEDMEEMFKSAKFNGDISNWDVSNVRDMNLMFYASDFNGDISNWKPYNLIKSDSMFLNSSVPFPYWANYETKEDRTKAINAYHLAKELNEKLPGNDNSPKKLKL